MKRTAGKFLLRDHRTDENLSAGRHADPLENKLAQYKQKWGK
jgi:hypothetical protein